MSYQVLTEAELLSGLQPGSRIISPSAITCIKHPDGQWWNWSNNVCTGRTLQAAHVITAGSKAYCPNEGRERYVKHADGRWLSTVTQPANGPFTLNAPAGHSSGHHAAAGRLREVEQAIYHSGVVPITDTLVRFNVPVSSAARGDVRDKDRQAFTADLTMREKVSIRFGFPFIEASEYKARQHNLKRGGLPITRGQLAMIVADEIERAAAALRQINVHIARGANGLPVGVQDLILVDVKRVSDGSLQPTIAVRGA
ncbi:hypothetical protein GSI_10088 [Ganoderma sinense ZZ0214-1]|uniref:Uncharacterized protein n=1 Tax=Ganoderma sinense ZZ0214-1 TaxID=1077348 RepID=A0A2G8RZJ9_9APHY|nr:hypothetical protein GSI_10088 [Ganoderma sinense ZZ0214-1]